MRVELRTLSLLFCGLGLVACPTSNNSVGDLPLGEYDVVATKVTDTCEIGEVLQDGDFGFRVKLAADSDSDRVYMIVSVPPSYVEQGSVVGVFEGGELVFAGQNATSLPACGCSPLVSERFAFEPLTGTPDGGADPDGGTGSDGGPAADGGADAGTASDGGINDDGGSGLPELGTIVGLGGSLTYAVDTAAGCQERDADAGTGCTLPCEIGYLLAGNLR